ncbi:MAG: RNA-binding protein [candidate division WOR-3 bacterium]|jgi:RNA recognition motif-containing protein|nr:RNA-binding protein [candidate division WOR-3 bacterium]MCR4423622.1 RNA-binding protein [candidate division WOR-3 bacterium]MDH7518961.1 RNA-binding protein [bacterium]
MTRRLFVGNLPFSATETQLRDLFGQHGEVVSVNIVTDRFTNRPRGFAFVEMATDEAAQAAIAGLNGYTLEDRALNVNEARERTESRGGFGGRTQRGQRRGGRSGNSGGFSNRRW